MRRVERRLEGHQLSNTRSNEIRYRGDHDQVDDILVMGLRIS